MPVKDIDWRQLGACRGLDPGIFYPETDEEADSAKAVCGACGVRSACLEHALQRREKQGVWGGCTERERRRWRTSEAGPRSSATSSPTRT